MKTAPFNRLTLAVSALLLLALPLVASSQKEKNKNSRQHDQASSVEVRAAIDVFAGDDQDVIRRFFAAQRGSLPPGLAKRGGDLPSGLEKQLQRKGQLPPGLDKKVAAFPVDLERQLPPLKPGLLRGVIEGRAVIYSPKSLAVFDAFLVF